MQKYQDVVFNTRGQAVQGASVVVSSYPSGTPTIYSDNGSTVISNTLTTDANGHFQFYAADGRYSLSISGTGITTLAVTDILLEDPIDATAAVITGGTINNTTIGATTRNTGAFTSITSTLGIQTTGAVASGYGTGAGGTVTQLTDKSTAVTLNTPTGQITMNNAALGGATTVSFVLNNSLIGANDGIKFTIGAVVGNAANYNIWESVAAGAVNVFVRNISAGPLSHARVINFQIIKGAIT